MMSPPQAETTVALKLAPALLVVALGWGLVVGLSWLWNVQVENQTVLRLAETEARSRCEKDLVFRDWAAARGGIYHLAALTTAEAEIPTNAVHSELRTAAGQRLTLVEPDTMLRQIHTLAKEAYGIRSRVTSLRPSRTENAADPWEARALESCNAGSDEVVAVETLNGQQVLRLLRPMKTVAACLSCHEELGHSVGDIRGGLSVSVPLADYQPLARARLRPIAFGHAVVAALGFIGLWCGHRQLARSLRARDQAAMERLENESRFRLLFDNITSISTQGYGPDGTVRFWNKGSEALYGYSAGEAQGRNLVDLIIPGERKPAVRQAITRMFETGVPLPAEELNLLRKDGTVVPVYSAHAIVDSASRGRELYCLDVDISRLKRSEAALKRRGAILEAVCFAAERFLCVTNWRTTIHEVLARLGAAAAVSRVVLFEASPGADGDSLWSQTHEWAAPELCPRTGDPTLMAIPLRAAGFARWLEHFSRGEIVQGVVRDFPSSEQPALLGHGILSIAVVPVLQEGSPWAFLAFDDCSTERAWSAHELEVLRAAAALLNETVHRQQTAQTLKRLTQQRSMILDSAAEGIVGLDTAGIHTFVNPSASRMLGWDPAELIGCPSHATWHHTRRDGEPYPNENCPILKTLMVGSAERRTDELFWRKDGTSFPVEYTSTPIHEDGDIVGAVVTFTDITERVHLERSFLDAQRMEAVGQLAGGVAHDFNNILAASLLQLNLLQQSRQLSGELRDSIQELESDMQRAARLTRQLLMFSRRSVLQRKELDLNTMVEGLLNMLRRLIGAHVSIEWTPFPGVPAVMADAAMIEQVIVNLVVNARDAMPDGGAIHISTRPISLNSAQAEKIPHAAPGVFAALVVRDTGCGMDHATLRRIFEPFYTTKPVGKGTGLGLAAVYGIARQHGGCVAVESEVAKGSTFSVLFPALDHAVASTHEPRREHRVPQGGGATVLLVEDEAPVRKHMSSFLRSCNYTVIEAADGFRALELWRSHQGRVDLLLTDLLMPKGMNGLQLADGLRALDPALKVVITSGYTSDLLQPEDLRARRIVFLEKPFSPHRLAECVHQCLLESQA